MHFSKYVLPTIPPIMAFLTFCSNTRLLFCSTSAASLFKGSSGLGSYVSKYDQTIHLDSLDIRLVSIYYLQEKDIGAHRQWN